MTVFNPSLADPIKTNQTVGIAEMLVSSNPGELLVTYSLGSCIGLTLYDPVRVVGGLIHCMLPLSTADPEKAAKNPFMFTDSGVMALLKKMYERGAERERLIAKLAGAASICDQKNLFKIGERNYTIMRKILWKNNILIRGELVGGNTAKTMYLHMGDGRTVIKESGRMIEI